MWRIINSLLLFGGFFILSTFSVYAQEVPPIANADLSPGKWLLTQDPLDPTLRLRYFPTIQVRILSNNPDGTAASKLKAALTQQVAPYFLANPKRVTKIGTLLTFWSTDITKSFWGEDHFDSDLLAIHLKEKTGVTVRDQAIMHWSWMRIALDELNRPADKGSQIWLASFFGNLERRYSDAKILLEVDPFYAVKAYEFMSEFWQTCQSEYNNGSRSQRFIHMGEIYSRYRDQAFSGVDPDKLNWTKFEKNLETLSFEKLTIEEVSFLIVLHRLEIEERLTASAPWGRVERDRILELASLKKVWGVIPGESKEKVYSWSKPEAEKKYREKKIAQKVQNLNPLHWGSNPYMFAAMMGTPVGMLIRSYTKPLRNLASMRGPVPPDLLERQMAENARGTVAHEEARAKKNIQEAQRQAAVEYAVEKFVKGAELSAFFDAQLESRRAGIQARLEGCQYDLAYSAQATQTIIQARRSALFATRRSAISGSSQSNIKPEGLWAFSERELGAKHWYQRWQPKYWKMRRLAGRYGTTAQKRWIHNPHLSPTDRFTAMLPAESLRLSLWESSLSRFGTVLFGGGVAAIAIQGTWSVGDYFWGAEEPNFAKIAQDIEDPLWNETLAQRETSMDQVLDAQLDSIISEFEDLQTAWNPTDEDRPSLPEPVKIKIVADKRSASDPEPETGKVESFFVLIHQEVPGSDPISAHVNRLNGYVLRFQSVWDSMSSPDIRKAGKVGWALTGIQQLEGASPNVRNQLALALRNDGVDYWLDPIAAEIIFVGTKAIPSNHQ